MSFKDTIEQALTQTGISMKASAKAVAQLTAIRASELSVLVGLPGYEQATVAARDEIALAAGLSIVGEADALTGRVLSIIQGGLMLLAGAAV
jgi:hypothetical protein